MIPPAEFGRRSFTSSTEQIGLRREELPSLVREVLGFKTTSAKLKELVEKALTSMVNGSEIASRDQKLFPPE